MEGHRNRVFKAFRERLTKGVILVLPDGVHVNRYGFCWMQMVFVFISLIKTFIVQKLFRELLSVRF